MAESTNEPTLQTVSLQLEVLKVHLEYQKVAIADGVSELRELRHRVEIRIDKIEAGITPHLGSRVVALEKFKDNFEGRFLMLGGVLFALTILLGLGMQFWPLVKH